MTAHEKQLRKMLDEALRRLWNAKPDAQTKVYIDEVRFRLSGRQTAAQNKYPDMPAILKDVLISANVIYRLEDGVAFDKLDDHILTQRLRKAAALLVDALNKSE
jgi:hypothetical protein